MLYFDSLHVLWLGKTSYQPGKPSVSLVQVLYMFAEWISSSQTENGNLLLHQTNLWWGVSQSHPFIVPTFTNPDNATALGCLLTWLLQIPQSWFTVNETFDPTLHLTMADVQVDSSTNAQSFRVYIKCSKTDPFCKGCFIFLGRYSFPLVQWFLWQTTFISTGQAPDLSLFTRMVLLSHCLPFYKVPYNQQVSLESSQAIVFKLELQLLPLGRVFLTISFRLWGIGLLKLTSYMCVLQCKPSFLSQDDLLSRYELLYPSFGLLFWVLSELSICLWGSGFQGQEAPFSPIGLAWGLVAELPKFASHGSSLQLGAGCQ